MFILFYEKIYTEFVLFLYKLCCFISIFLLLFNYFQPNWIKSNLIYKFGATGHLFSRINEIDNYKNVDILFLGSSHTYRGFDPRIFEKNGIKTFNLGSSAQTPIQTNLLLNRYLDELNPKLIIYEIYPETFTLDGVESAIDIISNDKNDKKSFEMALKMNHVKVYNTFIYARLRELLHMNNNQNEAVIKSNDIYIKGGFVERKNSNIELGSMPNKSIEFNENQFKLFIKILNEINKRKIPFLLVYAPVTNKYYHSINNRDSIDNLFIKNWPYVNFNNDYFFSDSLHFFDKDHLNQSGVNLFNSKLIEFLEENEYLEKIKK